MSNPKPDFPTVIKQVFNRLRSLHGILVLAINATQTKVESHSSHTLVNPSFELPP